MCDAIALSGANLAYSNLPAAVRNGRDADARANMLMASMMGAVAFQKGLGVTHPLTHPLSSIAGLHHGTTNGVLLPHVLEFNRAASGDRLSDLAIAMSPCRWNLSSGRKLRTCCMGESADGRAVHHPRSAERV
jgi:alcohol dehydrogenase class IV